MEPQVIYVADEERVKRAIICELAAELRRNGVELFSVPAACIAGFSQSVPPESPARSLPETGVHFTPLDVGEWRSLLMSIQPQVSVGDTFNGVLAHYKSPLEFYMIYDQETSAGLCHSVHFKCRKMKSLNMSLAADQCQIGALVCAKYSLDQAWYRAEIVDICGAEVTVSYIDYGNMETLSRSDLLPLEDELRSCPIQSVWCVLNEFNENNRLHDPIVSRLHNGLHHSEAVIVRIIGQKPMGQFATVPRFVTEITLRNDDDDRDAFKVCLNP